MKHRAPACSPNKKAYKPVKQMPETAGSIEWIFAKETVLLDAKLKNEPVVFFFLVIHISLIFFCADQFF